MDGPASAWIEIDGRRWRATDPHIPDPLRQELVDALMDARRAVAAARRASDPDAEAAARRQVHRTKVALGERGSPWWDRSDGEVDVERVEAVVLALLDHRGPGSICPSDVARVVGGDAWRASMEPVREVVRNLAAAGTVAVTQRGEVLDPATPWRGPVRIRRPSG